MCRPFPKSEYKILIILSDVKMVETEQGSSEPKVKMSGGLNSLNSVSKKIQIRTKKKILGVVREQYLRSLTNFIIGVSDVLK